MKQFNIKDRWYTRCTVEFDRDGEHPSGGSRTWTG